MTMIGAQGQAGLVRQTMVMAQPARLPDWWAPLYGLAGNASAFLSPAWMQAWLDSYGADFGGTWVCWRRDGQVVAGMLLLHGSCRRKRVRLDGLYVNIGSETRERSPLVEFNSVLCLPGLESAVGADLAAQVATMRWQCVTFPGHENDRLASAFLGGLPSLQTEQEVRPAPYVDLRALGAGPVDATLSANTRSQLRRSARLYASEHGPLELVRASTLEQALQFLAGLAELHETTWRRRGQSGAFAHQRYAHFQRQLVESLWQSGGVDLLRLSAGSRPIGYLLNLVRCDKVSFIQSGFDYADDARLKPGMLSHLYAIEYYRSQGHAEYDFLAGEGQYKRAFARQSRDLCWTVVYRRSASLRLLLGAARFYHRLGLNAEATESTANRDRPG